MVEQKAPSLSNVYNNGKNPTLSRREFLVKLVGASAMVMSLIACGRSNKTASLSIGKNTITGVLASSEINGKLIVDVDNSYVILSKNTRISIPFSGKFIFNKDGELLEAIGGHIEYEYSNVANQAPITLIFKGGSVKLENANISTTSTDMYLRHGIKYSVDGIGRVKFGPKGEILEAWPREGSYITISKSGSSRFGLKHIKFSENERIITYSEQKVEKYQLD